MTRVKDGISRQFSLEAIWGRIARVLIVGGTWIMANSLPETPETWAGLVVGMLGASYSHKSKR